MRTRSCNQFCWVLLFINIHNIFDYPDPQLSGLFRMVPMSLDNRGSEMYPECVIASWDALILLLDAENIE